MRTGMIKSYNLKNSTGLITDENGQDIFFYLSKRTCLKIIKSFVSFEIVMSPTGLIADSITFLPRSLLNKSSCKRKAH